MSKEKRKNGSPRRSALQRKIMKVLFETSDAGLRNGEIAQIVERHHSSVSRALKRLVEQNVVQKDGHRFSLTDKGRDEIQLELEEERQQRWNETMRRQRLRSMNPSPETFRLTAPLADHVTKGMEPFYKMMEPFHKVMEMSAVVDGILWQQKELGRIADDLRARMLGVPDSFSVIGEQVAGLERLAKQFALPRDHLSSLEGIRTALALQPGFESLPSLARLEAPEASLLLQRHNEISSLIERIGPGMSFTNEILERIAQPLAPIEALLQHNRIGESLTKMALKPHLAYQEFALTHLGHAAQMKDVAQINRLSLVNAGADLLPSIVRGFELAALSPLPEDTAAFATTPKINVYTTLNEEIGHSVDLDDPTADVASEVTGSMTSKIVETGERLVQLVYDLNEESKREGNGYLFKPTNKAMLAFSIITGRIANDHDSFHVITDHLYFLLYEGSGEAKRLTEVTNDETLTPLWRLKDLRRDGRHDTDHGDASEARRKSHQIGQAYKSLIGRSVPRGSSDWRAAQHALYEQMVDMLEHIWYQEL